MTKRTKIALSLILVMCMLITGMPSGIANAENEPALQAAPDVMASLAESCKILNYVSESVVKERRHIARVPAEEDLFSYVFQNEDGSRTVYIMDEAVKYVDADGIIREKDLTLTSAIGGYTTSQNDVQLTIPNNPTNGIRISYNNKHISMIPQEGTFSGMPEISDGSVTYTNYYGEGTSLRYTPTLSGIKEDIILSSYNGTNSFSFMLNTGGLYLYQLNGRYFLADSKTSTKRIELGDVFTSDATGQFSIGTMTSQTITAGQIYRITITADEEFLTDDATVYPVTIDPTLEISSSSSSIEDVTIYSGRPTMNANWTYLHTGYYDDTYKIGRIMIRLPGLTGSSVYNFPTEFNITSVKFHIREATGTASNVVPLYSNTGNDNWSESSVTWNGSGAVLGIQYSAASPKYNTDTVYDITQLVKAWQAGLQNAKAGFILRNSSETANNKGFYSSEYSTTSYRPYVVVDYEVYSSHPEVNVDLVHDLAYNTRCAEDYNSGAYDRIEENMTLLKGIYASEFGIKVNFTESTCLSSYADTSCSSNPNASCTHAGNASCKNSSQTTLETYHHNNYYNIFYRIPRPNISQTFRLFFSGHETCMVTTSGDHRGYGYYGLTHRGLGLIMLTNFDGQKDELRTMVHEFGHLYHARDHYGRGQLTTEQIIAQTGDTRYNSNCIYGENKESSSVTEKMIICEGCRATIEAYRDEYDH